MKYLLLPANHKFYAGGLCSQSGIAKVNIYLFRSHIKNYPIFLKTKSHQ